MQPFSILGALSGAAEVAWDGTVRYIKQSSELFAVSFHSDLSLSRFIMARTTVSTPSRVILERPIGNHAERTKKRKRSDGSKDSEEVPASLLMLLLINH